MFRFKRKPSSGNHSQYLAKITHLVLSGYVELVQDVISVMAAYYDLWGVCTVHCVHSTHSAVSVRRTDTVELHRVYENMLQREQKCTDVQGDHFQHLL